MNDDRTTGIKWLPFGLLFPGLILKWIHIDNQGILLNIGFISFGLVTLIVGVKAKYHRQINLDTIKLVLPLIAILLSLDNLLTGNSNYTILGIAILFQYILGQGRRLITPTQSHSMGGKREGRGL